MGKVFLLSIVSFSFSTAHALCGSDVKGDPGRVLAQVINHSKEQRTMVKGALGHVIMQSKMGKESAVAEFKRTTDSQGQVKYEQIPVSTNNPRAIRMAVEQDERLTPYDRRRTEFTDENYGFQFLGANGNIYRFKLIPVEHREGLVDGEYWIDTVQCTPVHIEGSVMNNHGFFLRQFDMFEDLQTINGVVLPKRLLLTFKLFAFIKTYLGTLDTTSEYRVEDVVLN